ncbi:peptidyl-tRNA hydrolase [Planococcus glaciei]|jgi:PTH1 family peptidyl-tRNA hydrolase|uniref:aminoacyl-tRNA hydrolase n=1 Tax=Planococcus glaciei TaxID=459472 RepID=UPI00069D0421|nr:aminoacyl-tRNA hydrolase [Planococcus glaciei]KOF09089.1 peptidyl-tRNA hydrolase [Planococcus glaciei]MBX0316881.1 aminoacyl-tRNA hydrolase [Planococcus glaciei]SDI52078.1 peptidyl-tRNA hydrolase, PTH1 family [Planococcus glaciei]
MKLIIGLGNPGKTYEQTRHNIGFKVIDYLASKWNAPLTQTKFKGMYSIIHRPEGKVMLLKPLTYMNLSGESVGALMDYYDIDIEDIVVIYDDLDLPTGQLRLRQKGSAGGHNGIKSLIQHLGTQQFNRIRIGISRPPAGMKVPDYVLSRFSDNETPEVAEAVKQSAEACELWLSKAYPEVMNNFNGS